MIIVHLKEHRGVEKEVSSSYASWFWCLDKVGHHTSQVLELTDIVTKCDRVVILGDPGSGKSTLLRYLALTHAQALMNGSSQAEKGLGLLQFPILIRIAEYAEEGTWKKTSLSDFLVDCCRIHDCPHRGLADLLQHELEQGNCLILLDGLDEIVNADERLAVVRHIEDFVRRYSIKANRFVITSRIAGYRHAPLGESFAHYTVREMNETQIRSFLERWCQAVEDAQTPELALQERQNTARREINGILRAIQTPGVRRLAVNPLLLRILALIHRTGARLPQKRIELYKLAADTLARTWRTAQGVSEKAMEEESVLLKEEYLTPLLSKLAYWLHVLKPTGIATEREVYNILGEEWAHLSGIAWDADDPSPKIVGEIRKFLAAVHQHTGLFVERAPRRYGFMHLTFEEYYVARYLVARRRSCATLIRKHLYQPRWEEPILLALGFVGLDFQADASELMEIAILAEGEEAKELGFTASKYEDMLGRDYLFALRCLGDNTPARPELLSRLIDRLAHELLYETGSTRFQYYQQALDERLTALEGSSGGEKLLSLLISALKDRNASVRSNAAESLGRIAQPTPEVVSALLAALKDNDASVRGSAVLSLGKLGQVTDGLIATLRTLLFSPYSWVVRRDAAKLLGQIDRGDKATLDDLWQQLLDKDNDVRKGCIQALVRLAKRYPTLAESIEVKFYQAIQNPDFQKPDAIEKRPAYDYIYDGLRSLVIEGEAEDA